MGPPPVAGSAGEGRWLHALLESRGYAHAARALLEELPASIEAQYEPQCGARPAGAGLGQSVSRRPAAAPLVSPAITPPASADACGEASPPRRRGSDGLRGKRVQMQASSSSSAAPRKAPILRPIASSLNVLRTVTEVEVIEVGVGLLSEVEDAKAAEFVGLALDQGRILFHAARPEAEAASEEENGIPMAGFDTFNLKVICTPMRNALEETVPEKWPQ